MKIQHAFLAFIFLGLLSACRVPFAPPPATPTPEPSASVTPPPSLTPRVSVTTAPTHTPGPTETATLTRTPKPSATVGPTATSIYPVGLGTTLPNPGFVEITTDNVAKLTAIAQIVQPAIWQSAISRDGKQLFVATNSGVSVYDRQGAQLFYWTNVRLPSEPCEGCMSINTDGSRFAVMTHRDGKWLAQVYNVFDNNANLLLEKPIDSTFQGIPNEVSVALSPDGLMLAYGTSDGTTLLTDLNSSQTLLSNPGGSTSVVFSPDGAYFVIRHARQLLLWKTPNWKNPTILQLPTEDATYAFSADSKRLAIAQTDKITAYRLDTLTANREIFIKTPKDVKRKWQIAFVDQNILSGYATRWNTDHTKANVDVGQWNLDTGETLQFGSHETNAPDGLSALWGGNIPTTPPIAGPVPIATQYITFRFIDEDQMLINSLHSACWIKLFSGENTCYNDDRVRVFSSETQAFREIRTDRLTALQDWQGRIVSKMDQPYPILAVMIGGNYRLVNVKDATTDLYSGQNSLTNSFPGSLINFADNTNEIFLSLKQKNSGMVLTMFDINNQKTLYLRNVDFVLKALALTKTNEVYFTQANLTGQSGVNLKKVDTNGFIIDVAVVPLPLIPDVMAISNKGTFAFGMKDGTVSIVSSNGLQLASFQATYTPIRGIALSADGRFVAVASDDGIRIFAVFQ